MICATDSRAVLLADVADHPLARRGPRSRCRCPASICGRVEEALEEEVVGERVEVGDLEAVGDDRARRRAAARADRDARSPWRSGRSPRRSGSRRRSPSPRSPPARTPAARPPRPAGGRRSGRAAPRRRFAAAWPPAPRRRRSGTAAAAACPARSPARSARRSPAWSAPPRATRRRTRIISSLLLRKNSLVSKLIFGASSVDLVCTQSSAAWLSKSSRRR